MQQDSQRDQLRSALRHSRANLSAAQVQSCSESICQKVETLIQSTHAEKIAGYYAFGNEVDLSVLMFNTATHNRSFFVPIILPEFRMQFAPVDAHTVTTQNRYGIKEPQVPSSAYVQASSLDAVLVPLVGFDNDCNRMGMGGGYYDRCFEHRKHTTNKPLLIGVAYEMQRADDVFTEEWDVPLDYVITEQRTIQRKNKA